MSLPAGWFEFSLKDVCKLQGGKTPSKANSSFWEGGSICWASPKDMKVSKLLDTQDKVTQDAIEAGGLLIYPENSILFVVRSGILAHSFPVALTKMKTAVNQDLKVITPNQNINQRYLVCMLNAFYLNILNDCSKSGTTVSSIEVPKLESYPFPLAPLAEQKIIAQKLDSLLAQVESTKARLERTRETLKRFRRSVLAAAVSGKLTEEWRKQKGFKLSAWDTQSLANITSSISDGDHQAPPKADSGIPFLVISNVSAGFIDFKGVSRWVPEPYFNSLKKNKGATERRHSVYGDRVLRYSRFCRN